VPSSPSESEKDAPTAAHTRPTRPDDHIDQPDHTGDTSVAPPARLSIGGWLLYFWRQLTSMRTALLLLLLLAIAAVPGSLVPQRSSDPNGVAQYFTTNPMLAPILDHIQMFDVYSSVWFSAIYLLLFVSLIGCVVPRARHHTAAMRARPPRTPARLGRLAGYLEVVAPAGVTGEAVVAEASVRLRKARYRVERYESGGEVSVSAERGYVRETGNLIFHTALVGILITVGIGGGYGFTGQRVMVVGQSFVNTLAAYDSFNPGRFFTSNTLDPYRLTLTGLDVVYERHNIKAFGQPLDFTAHVRVGDQRESSAQDAIVKVNQPLTTHSTDIYLLGNGYAPKITVRNAAGNVVFTDSVPFLPQDANLTSIGVVKVPDGMPQQLGLVGFFYPTQATLTTGAFASSYPDLTYPVLTLNVFEGDLGINAGTPASVYTLDTSTMTQLTGGSTGVASLQLKPGETGRLPNELGTITFDRADTNGTTADYSTSVARFVSFEIHHDPARMWVLVFAIFIVAGLLLSLFVPRRRLWVKAVERNGKVLIQYAGLARGDDHGLTQAVKNLAEAHTAALRTVSAEKLDLSGGACCGQDV